MLATLNKVMVSTDFSDAAANALNSAISICQQNGSVLTIVHVIDNSRIHFSNQSKIIFGPTEQIARIANENLNVLAFKIATNHNIHVEYQVLMGKPAHEICRFAIKINTGLIVIAKRGEFNLASLIVGDIAAQVVKLSRTPVLCVPDGRRYTKFQKVLFPIEEQSPVLSQYKVARMICSQASPLLVVAGMRRKSTLDFTPTRLIRLTELLVKKINHDGLRTTKIFNVCDDVPSAVATISNDVDTDLICLPISAKKREKPNNDYAMNVLTRSSCSVLAICQES